MHSLRVLVGRWSRRDWFAVLVIAFTVALLVGATLLVVAAGEQATTLAADFDSNATVTSYDSIDAAHDAAGADAVVLPLATAISPEGEHHRVVGIPATSSAGVDLPTQRTNPVGPSTTTATWRLEGTNDSFDRAVTPAPAATSSDILPSSWVRTTPATLEQLGPTGALVLIPAEEPAESGGTPVVSALAFFVNGTADVLGIIWSGIVVAGVLVAVTLSSVVRLTIRERAQTIRVLRATGAPPRRVRTALALRAGLLVATGATLGYAIGVIVPNAAVNVAVAAGLPTTLSVQLTADAVVGIGALLGFLTLVGTSAGYATAWVATRQPPLQNGTGHDTASSTAAWWCVGPVICQHLRPIVLSARTIGPTTATLSTFAVIVLLVASLGTIGASFSTDATTITEPGVAHPISSRVPASYSDAIAAQAGAASPEILLFGSYDGQPYLARGVEYEAFAAVTGAQIVEGEPSTAPDEAVIGAALAETLDIAPGDELALGGSTDAAVTQVTVVGMYTTNGLADHQLLVPLPTARHLSRVDEGYVHLVRTTAPLQPGPGGSATDTLTVIATDIPSHLQAGEPVSVNVTVWNPTDDRVERALTATLGDSQVTQTVSLAARQQRTVTLSLPAPVAGKYTLVVDGTVYPVTVVETPPLELTPLPATAPPDASLRLRVREATGAPVDNATVKIGESVTETDANGSTWLQTPHQAGTYRVTVRADGRERTQSIQISETHQPLPVARGIVSPQSPTIHTQPTVEVTLTNPWNRPLEVPITIDGPATTQRSESRLEPGETTTLTTQLPHRPPGEYVVRVTAGGRQLTTTTYQVSGDEQVVSALATSGYTGGGGLGSAITYAIGNLQVVLGVLVALAAVTVVGATSLVLARAVRAQRHTLAIYRATGASPRRILALILNDALRIGAVAAIGAFLLALGFLEVLAAAGQLTGFGITLDPRPTLQLAGAVLGGGLLLTLLAAVIATVPLVRTPPAALLTASRPPSPDTADPIRSSSPADHGRSGSGGDTAQESDTAPLSEEET
ncbi:FtsX-like permease family protein [Natrinema gelatinilyticum]|uniref:FtsX-like permease family protein n=1 Tax=Natrinema gelatinilyticum TaxID=2961571 RepID=UPI0020C47F44|nr:FtsX-like permease family protein [Natrinema gelatinilyticum]